MKSTTRAMNYALQQGRKGGLLFTPGPLGTSATVKEAMLTDYGSRDSHFVNCIKEVRSKLLAVGDAPASEWSAIPMQGSGTMGIEAVINSTTKKPVLGQGASKYLVIKNGAYSKRMAAVIEKLGIPLVIVDTPEGEPIDLGRIEAAMKENPDITNVGVVHCETSTGMMNPVEEISELTRKCLPNATLFLDTMSAFGGVQCDIPKVCDVMVSSANKCIQGVPGFSFVLARKSVLEANVGVSSSFTLDLPMQCKALDSTGQFPFTPPVHAIVAFHQALLELEAEGGVAAREARYRAIAQIVIDGMTAMGFKLFLDPARVKVGHIITAFHMPKAANWDFKQFYGKLQDAGFVIYPGKASDADTFRIGSIGDLQTADAAALIKQIETVLAEMNVNLKA